MWKVCIVLFSYTFPGSEIQNFEPVGRLVQYCRLKYLPSCLLACVDRSFLSRRFGILHYHDIDHHPTPHIYIHEDAWRGAMLCHLDGDHDEYDFDNFCDVDLFRLDGAGKRLLDGERGGNARLLLV